MLSWCKCVGVLCIGVLKHSVKMLSSHFPMRTVALCSPEKDLCVDEPPM